MEDLEIDARRLGQELVLSREPSTQNYLNNSANSNQPHFSTPPRTPTKQFPNIIDLSTTLPSHLIINEAIRERLISKVGIINLFTQDYEGYECRWLTEWEVQIDGAAFFGQFKYKDGLSAQKSKQLSVELGSDEINLNFVDYDKVKHGFCLYIDMNGVFYIGFFENGDFKRGKILTKNKHIYTVTKVKTGTRCARMENGKDGEALDLKFEGEIEFFKHSIYGSNFYRGVMISNRKRFEWQSGAPLLIPHGFGKIFEKVIPSQQEEPVEANQDNEEANQARRVIENIVYEGAFIKGEMAGIITKIYKEGEFKILKSGKRSHFLSYRHHKTRLCYKIHKVWGNFFGYPDIERKTYFQADLYDKRFNLLKSGLFDSRFEYFEKVGFCGFIFDYPSKQSGMNVCYSLPTSESSKQSYRLFKGVYYFRNLMKKSRKKVQILVKRCGFLLDLEYRTVSGDQIMHEGGQQALEDRQDVEKIRLKKIVKISNGEVVYPIIESQRVSRIASKASNTNGNRSGKKPSILITGIILDEKRPTGAERKAEEGRGDERGNNNMSSEGSSTSSSSQPVDGEFEQGKRFRLRMAVKTSVELSVEPDLEFLSLEFVSTVKGDEETTERVIEHFNMLKTEKMIIKITQNSNTIPIKSDITWLNQVREVKQISLKKGGNMVKSKIRQILSAADWIELEVSKDLKSSRISSIKLIDSNFKFLGHPQYKAPTDFEILSGLKSTLKTCKSKKTYSKEPCLGVAILAVDPSLLSKTTPKNKKKSSFKKANNFDYRQMLNQGLITPLLIHLSEENSRRKFQKGQYKFDEISMPEYCQQTLKDGYIVMKDSSFPEFSFKKIGIYEVIRNSNSTCRLPDLRFSMLGKGKGWSKPSILELSGSAFDLKMIKSENSVFLNSVKLEPSPKYGSGLAFPLKLDSTNSGQKIRKSNHIWKEFFKNTEIEFSPLFFYPGRFHTFRLAKESELLREDSKEQEFKLEEENLRSENFLEPQLEDTLGSILCLESGLQSKGEIAAGLLNGSGTQKSESTFWTSIRSKSFKYGQAMTKATITYKNDAIYRGEVKFGLRHGKGQIEYINGESYLGEWLMGLRHGYGELTQVDGSRFQGNFEYGRFNGEGSFYSNEGLKFEGYFVNGDFLCGSCFDSEGNLVESI